MYYRHHVTVVMSHSCTAGAVQTMHFLFSPVYQIQLSLSW